MTTSQGKPKKSALLVIDVQDSFKASEKRWSSRSNLSFEKNVSELISAFRTTAQPIIFVMHSDKDAAFGVNSPYYKLMDFLDYQDSDLLLHKTTRSSFPNTNLDAELKKLGVEHLVVTGIQTEQCCETTTRHAADLGYSVDFVTEATLTFPIKHWSEDKVLSCEAIIERTEYALANRFARIATVDDVLTDLNLTDLNLTVPA